MESKIKARLSLNGKIIKVKELLSSLSLNKARKEFALDENILFKDGEDIISKECEIDFQLSDITVNSKIFVAQNQIGDSIFQDNTITNNISSNNHHNQNPEEPQEGINLSQISPQSNESSEETKTQQNLAQQPAQEPLNIPTIPLTFKSKDHYIKIFTKHLNNQEKALIAKQKVNEKECSFEFLKDQMKQITRRICLHFKNKTPRFNEEDYLKLRIPTISEQEEYTGIGKVYKIYFINKKQTDVLVDINCDTEIEEKQKLPSLDIEIYKQQLFYQEIDRDVSILRMRKVLEHLKEQVDVSTEIVRTAILTGKPQKPINVKIPSEFYEDGLPKTFNKSQLNAIKQAMTNRVTLIQGPPGTGKTTTLCAIVVNWMKINNQERILICAPSNPAADLIAEQLYQIPMLQEKFVRFYSQKKEDIFNLNPATLKPYSLQSRILYLPDELQRIFADQMIDQHLANVKMQLEFYFGDQNYPTDEHLHKQMDENGYVQIEEILKWNQMKLKWKGTHDDVIKAADYTSIFEISPNYMSIRKKKNEYNNKFRLLGLDEQGIRNLSIEKFDIFKKAKKDLEDYVLEHAPIIVCTCISSKGPKLSQYTFKRVIVDEAAQAKELECFLPCQDAAQMVLIGDHKQLGPVYLSQFKGPQSLFERLVQAGYPFEMLKEQHRMHPFLLRIPNQLFYNEEIVDKYKKSIQNLFINKDKPFIFINVNGVESAFGTSFLNKQEADIAFEFTKFLIETMKYKKEHFGFVSPYLGQTHLLQRKFTALEMDQNVRTIDSWQGREKELIIFSCVRNNSQTMGFLKESNRINVALTRAKHGLVMIGSRSNLSLDEKWKRFLDELEEDNVIVNGLQDAINYVKTMKEINKKQQENYSCDIDFM